MCFSFRTSLFSYSIAIASAIFAFCTRQIVLGALILAYAQIQLSEMMIWYGIDNNDKSWNRFGTNFGKYMLATHNIAVGIGLILAIMYVAKRPLRKVDFLPLVAGLLLFLGVAIFVYPNVNSADVTYPRAQTCNKCQSPENRLQWPYPQSWYLISYALSMAVLYFWIKPSSTRTVLMVIFTLTLVLSFLIYPKTVGSVWCWSASFIAPALVLINYMLIKDKPSGSILS